MLSNGATGHNVNYDRYDRPMSEHYKVCPSPRVKAGDAGEGDTYRFYRCSNQWPGHIHVMRSSDGQDEQALTHAAPNRFLRGPHSLNQNMPDWSRAHGGVAYWEGQIVTGPGDAVARMRSPQGGRTPPVRLTDLSGSGAMADDPVWSPDGRWIAYASYQGGGIFIGLSYITKLDPPIDQFKQLTTLTRLGGSVAPNPTWQDWSGMISSHEAEDKRKHRFWGAPHHGHPSPTRPPEPHTTTRAPHVHMHSLSGQVGGWEGREGKGGESAEEHSTRHHPLLRIGPEVAP